MHAFVQRRIRSTSIASVAPKEGSEDHSTHLAALATKILYRSPLKSPSDLPIFILNSAALPNAKEINFDALLPYVLARLPDEDELIGGKGYEVVFFAGGEEGVPREKEKPSVAWMFKAYHVLSRVTRKRLQRLYIVHERKWVRVCIEAFSHVVSPKFRKKVVHVSSLKALSSYVPLEDLLIPPSAYFYDRTRSRKGHPPEAKRAFGVTDPLPISSDGSHRLPRVLRESTSFILLDQNVRTEGLFRVNARATTVDILAEAYDRGQKFVIWKEKGSVLTYSHFQEGVGDVMPGEIEQTEGFGVQAAAGLIKRWYAELREPIFPLSTYAYMKQTYGHGLASIQTSSIYEDLRPDVDDDDHHHARLPKTSRQILTLHLLPLLATVADGQDFNHMTPKNLALCLAPNLIRGTDQLQEEVEMSETVSHFLEAAIASWKKPLSSRLGLDASGFHDSLRTPEAVRDREDPPERVVPSEPGLEQLGIEDEFDGITMVDDEDGAEDARELEAPFLPSRLEDPAPQDGKLKATVVSRKPAPAVRSANAAQTQEAIAYVASSENNLFRHERPVPAQEEVRQNIPASLSRKPVSRMTAPETAP